MQLFLAIIGAILAIFVIILLHEWGHFLAARFFGIRILRFSIGFGKALYTWYGKTGTEYVIAAIPLGGYIRMVGDESTDIPERYCQKPLPVRMAVVLAGPLVNFILAVFVFWITFMMGSEHLKPIVGVVMPHSFASDAGMQRGDEIVAVGGQGTKNWQQVGLALMAHMGDVEPVAVTVKPHCDVHHPDCQTAFRLFHLSQWALNTASPEILQTVGIRPYFPVIRPIVVRVMPHSPAEQAGIRPGDEIRAVNQVPVVSWSEVVKAIQKRPGQKTVLTIDRKQVNVQLRTDKASQTRGYLGVVVSLPPFPSELLYWERYGPVEAIFPALEKTAMLSQYNAIFLKKLFTAKLSVDTVGGPISIFQAAGQASQAGWNVYLSFIGFLSISIGFINLLPIPGLDGGHFLFQMIESVIRRPVPLKVQQYGFVLGVFLIILVILNATVNDVVRIFHG